MLSSTIPLERFDIDHLLLLDCFCIAQTSASRRHLHRAYKGKFHAMHFSTDASGATCEAAKIFSQLPKSWTKFDSNENCASAADLPKRWAQIPARLRNRSR
jgi:hypothetical protein